MSGANDRPESIDLWGVQEQLAVTGGSPDAGLSVTAPCAGDDLFGLPVAFEVPADADDAEARDGSVCR